MSNPSPARLEDGAQRQLPVLPLRDVVVFPQMAIPLIVGRPASIRALDEALRGDRLIFLVSQRDASVEEPSPEQLFGVGCVCGLLQLLRLPDGTVKVLVEGQRRGLARRHLAGPGFALAEVELPVERTAASDELPALMRAVSDTFEAFAKGQRSIPAALRERVRAAVDPGRLADLIASQLAIKLPDRQALLEQLDAGARLARVHELLENELQIASLEQRIRARVKKQMEKSQKEYYLNEQLAAIHKELGDPEDQRSEVEELAAKLAVKKLPDEARERIARELVKLKKMSPMSAETAVVRNYIDWCLALPWQEYSVDTHDLANAERILEEDHYGLAKPKERILEYLAVRALVEEMRGPILCFVGPPGVGKTSLGRSIARCTGRKFVRLSLGGVRDEAEIRGHRRTYIGALPGKIIQSLRRAGTGNPVLVLDEVDKLAMDFRGDPAAALLEVLDPEVNATFNDHYLDLDYDLSRVLFVCTANSLQHVPPALQDRMEVIRIPGYTEPEKLAIARRFLIPKQQKENGLAAVSIEWPRTALEEIVRHYTREAGVRNLERELASVCRKLARAVASGKARQPIRLTPHRVTQHLGVPRYPTKRAEERSTVGMAHGLAWTEAGGELLTIEVALMPGKGKLLITGKLGEVMRESAQAAMTYVRARARRLGLAPDFHAQLDVHVHIPEGAMPKDGPSAGITIATALVSALTRAPVRHDVAMTGEITLRGRVLPIGGLKEKALAAHQAACGRVLYPRDNDKDLPELPAAVRAAVDFVGVAHMDEVLVHALDLPAGTTLDLPLDPDPPEVRAAPHPALQ